MTHKMLLFKAAIASGKSGLQAAKDAGYQGSDKVLSVTACRLLKTPNMQAALNTSRANIMAAAELDVEWALRRMMDEVAKPLPNPARIRALELLGKQVGLYKDKLGVDMTVSTLTPEDRERHIQVLLEEAISSPT